VVLPDVASLWHVLWPLKKEMYGRHGLIPVGGRAPGEDEESDAEEATKAPPVPRNAGTSEPVAWHAMPQLFWQEILFDFKVGAVIDLTPADGTLAMAALNARIPYTGLTFTSKHAEELLGRLQSLVLAGATREGDSWYDPHLVDALTTKPTAKAKAKADPAAAKAKPKPKPKANGGKPAKENGDDPKDGTKPPKKKKAGSKGAKKKGTGKHGADPDDAEPFLSSSGSENDEGSPSEPSPSE
jgi:hypothetical protein